MSNNNTSSSTINRRQFVRESALAAAGLAVALNTNAAAAPKPLNFNPNMEYRRLGKTGLMVSAVCLGGHWKRLNNIVPDAYSGDGWLGNDVKHAGFAQNRHDIVSHCIDTGINYIDACTGNEVLAYSAALKGRRERMYLGYSWYEKEARNGEFRTTAKLLQSLDEGLKEAGLEYIDLWRITCHEQGGNHTFNETAEIVGALEQAKEQGKARYTGVSSHDRRWLKMLIEEFPEKIDVIVTPYTAKSKVLPQDSLFDTVTKYGVGVFGIKPFASGSLFKGDSTPNHPNADEDDQRARLAIRYILGNTAITAPIPGLITKRQIDNMAKAVMERRELDQKESAALDRANEETWAKLPADYQWLKDWEYV